MRLRGGGETVWDIRLLPRHTTSDQRVCELGVEVEDGQWRDEDGSHRIVLIICDCVAAVSMNSARRCTTEFFIVPPQWRRRRHIMAATVASYRSLFSLLWSAPNSLVCNAIMDHSMVFHTAAI